ncbi:MAG: pyridoxal phosphate-dependent aminotransferase, partial [Clostridia bacterium]|nr:pyridoxal phosphate-dependent aminotransferase [Clostridia bacterium]
TISLSAIAEEGDRTIVLAPFFPEYTVFIRQAGMEPVVVKCSEQDFQIDFDALQAAIDEHTKAIIINSPNNPSGVVFSPETIKKLAEILNAAQEKYNREIFIIADEPYRELVYDDSTIVPFIPNYYNNTIVCYSFSKSLSLPGERIGYILVPNTAKDWKTLYFAVCGAGRSLGFVCAPNLFQKMVPYCIGKTADVSVYKKNRDILCEALSKYGYTVAQPDGAFYLFVKALEDNASAFCEKAKKHELLLVPSDSFGFPGYVRISYCVSTEMIQKALPSFEALAKEYK